MNYSGTKCLHPRRIFKDGRYITVRCGHCEHCVMLRSSRLKMLCDFELSVSNQSFFVTLTYAEDYLPMLECKETNVYFDKSKRFYVSSFDCYNISSRLAVDCIDVDDCYLGSFSMVKRDFIDLWHKSAKSYKGVWRPRYHMPYLHPADAQLFLKRLRYYINQYNKSNHAITKLRYYALGEYTPKRFRPHWHFLFFLDSPIPTKVFKSFISKSWQFGTVDISLISGNAADYVTQYSCGANLVSPLHSLPTTRPRVLHSINFGGSVLDSIPTSVGEDNVPVSYQRYNFPSTISFNGNASLTQYWIFGNLAYRRLPRCPRYASMSHGLRCLSYMLYPFSVRRYGECNSVSDYAKMIVQDIDVLLYDNSFSDLFKMFVSLYNTNPNYPFVEGTSPWLPDVFYSSIYTTLLCSRKFYKSNNLVLSSSYSAVSNCLKRLDHVYSDYELSLLKSFYESQSSVSLMESFDVYKSCFYDDYPPEDCTLSPIYNSNCASRVDLYNKKRKHRLLNEANDRFCYNKFDPNSNII